MQEKLMQAKVADIQQQVYSDEYFKYNVNFLKKMAKITGMSIYKLGNHCYGQSPVPV